MPPPNARTSSRRFLPYVLTVFLIATAAVIVWYGWSFYKLPLEDRPGHPRFRQLRPSGLVGNGYGFVAGVLVFLNLMYLVRRRLGTARLGSMRVWLDIHVFTGLFAALLVSAHSALQLRNTIATVTAASLAVVVITGVVGRFLYALVPTVDRAELDSAIDALDVALPGTGRQIRTALAELPPPPLGPHASLLTALRAMPAWRKVARDRRDAIALIVGDPPEARWLIKRVDQLAVGEARAAGSAAMLRAWRGLHRFAAILMLVTVLVHVGVAWHYGYRWVFGS
ncbi:MAG: hypothetical protein H6709_06605 [Kofleriaceae bacterium]|nr:hypothetical protein [Myxococcales bacterium]MCB9560324.1 hypothetical protein [Kofleriaceae bacterium]MCB9571746.1 hypothetical protein [Kofleriaceae bacterium]